MHVAFYFDPSCPFCWITSRWLLMVQADRDLSIDWRPFSLAIKNNELTAAGDANGSAAPHFSAHRILRVLLAAERQGAKLIDLYTAFGVAHHVGGEDFDNDLIARVLNQQQLPPDVLAAADDTGYDQALKDSTASATAVAGDDIGVPTIVFTADDGSQNGFFGPVLQRLPDKEAALRLWDGLSKLATDTTFYELKRSRPDDGPDVFSTAKC